MPAMKTVTVSLIAGLALGAAAVALVMKLTAPPPPVPSTEDVAKLRDDLKAAKTRVEQIEQVNADLASQLAKLKQAAATVTASTTSPPSTEKKPDGFLSALFGGGSDTNRAAEMRKIVEAGMKQHLNHRLNVLKFRLKLTDEQEQQLRATIDRQAAKDVEMASKLFEGKLSEDEKSNVGGMKDDFETEIKQILTPEQLAEYEAYKTEERKNHAQMVANSELSQMQTMLRLTDDQQEKVFNVLYSNAEQTFNPDNMTNPGDWQKAWQQREDAKADAFKTILTPEQFDAYQRQKQ
jgi:Spy/CpxP family protein refolding chaperone